MTDSIEPFRVDIPQAQLDDLHTRLTHTRWPHSFPDTGWDYGTPAMALRELADYWRTGYDWRRNETELNSFPQFVTTIDGQRLHFTHVRSDNPDALALVLLHGWPFADFRPVIPALRKTFHLVIPTLPGFGFSGPTVRPGELTSERSAGLIATLMARLGYDRYGAHGGDWGSFIAPQIGRIDTEQVVGVHLNDPLTIPAWDDDGAGYSVLDQEKLAALQDWSNQDTSSYAGIHATRPQSLAPGLNDSPAGLLAWVLDVVHTFAHEQIDRDLLLTDVSILWFTETIGSSILLYKEATDWGARPTSSGVPTAISVFPGGKTIRAVAERQNNVVAWTEHEHGGHFPSMQTPDLLAADLLAFFRTSPR